jgi:DNA-binding NtrC family response regulator
LTRLQTFRWPGNVRQLENAVEMAVALSDGREVLYPVDFPALCRANPTQLPGDALAGVAVPEHGLDFERTIGQIERQILEDTLRKTNGNKSAAASMLGLKRTTLAAKLRSLEMETGSE